MLLYLAGKDINVENYFYAVDAAALSSPVASRGTNMRWIFSKESFLIDFCLYFFTLTINIVLNL